MNGALTWTPRCAQLLTTLCNLYPASKIFQHLVVGLGNKSKRCVC
jgi:hypothetical protein